MTTDIPTLSFVDPLTVQTTYRIGLYAAPGEGKTVAACSAPTPILAVNADRPSAYAYARKHHGLSGDDLRELRYEDKSTLDAVYTYLRNDGKDVRTVILDPFSNIYDQLVRTGPKRQDGDLDYQKVNDTVMDFLKALRRFDVHVVVIAHEKLNDGKKGDNKLYPAFGGPSLINKVLAELDICARIVPSVVNDKPEWVGYAQPDGNFVAKDGTNAIGPRRVVNLTRWIELAREETAIPTPADDDLPWSDEPQPTAALKSPAKKTRKKTPAQMSEAERAEFAGADAAALPKVKAERAAKLAANLAVERLDDAVLSAAAAVAPVSLSDQELQARLEAEFAAERLEIEKEAQ